MPSRSILSATLIAAALAVLAPAAAARIVVFDATGHRVATPVREVAADELLRWSDDGTRLLVRDQRDEDLGRVFALDPQTGARTAVGAHPDLASLGPGGRWLAGSFDTEALVVTATLWSADGRRLATLKLPSQGMFDDFQGAWAAWSADGRRVAVSDDQAGAVLDADTGAVLRRIDTGYLDAQALSPDGGAVLMERGRTVVVLDVATGAQRVLGEGDYARWSPDGRTVLVKGRRAWVSGIAAPLTVPDDAEVRWSSDGSALTVAAPDPCGQTGTVRLVRVGTAAGPASAPTSVRLAAGSHQDVAWSPDGSRVAVELGVPPSPSDDPDHRGARHRWPKRIADRYDMPTARGDRAVRRAIGLFAADLRAGLHRTRALTRLGRALERIGATRWGANVEDTMVADAIAAEVNRWLRAAGFAPIDGATELDGDPSSC